MKSCWEGVWATESSADREWGLRATQHPHKPETIVSLQWENKCCVRADTVFSHQEHFSKKFRNAAKLWLFSTPLKTNFCPLLDQNIKFIGNVLPLRTLQTLTLVAHLFNTQRTDPQFCLAPVTFKDSHSAWERTDINNYRIKCCQGIMCSGCFGPRKAKATIKLSGKRAIINSMRITLYHTALLLLCQNKLIS